MLLMMIDGIIIISFQVANLCDLLNKIYPISLLNSPEYSIYYLFSSPFLPYTLMQKIPLLVNSNSLTITSYSTVAQILILIFNPTMVTSLKTPLSPSHYVIPLKVNISYSTSKVIQIVYSSPQNQITQHSYYSFSSSSPSNSIFHYFSQLNPYSKDLAPY